MLETVDLGAVPYPRACELQSELAARRLEGASPDTLLLVEHPPTYTRGRRCSDAELPMGEQWYAQRGIEVHETDRGGRVTYHGPGQLVAYPVVGLIPLGGDVVRYVRMLEEVVVDVLAHYGIDAAPNTALTGVWCGDSKIASIGIHVSHNVTTHGFAINANNSLEPFEWIVPCGIEGCKVTSMAQQLGHEVEMEGLKEVVAEKFMGGFTLAARQTLCHSEAPRGGRGNLAGALARSASLGFGADPWSSLAKDDSLGRRQVEAP